MKLHESRRLAASIGAAALLLAACGGNGDDGNGVAEPAPAPEEEGEEEPQTDETEADESAADHDPSSVPALQWGAGGEGSVNAEAALATGQVLRSHGLELYTVNTGGTVDGLIAVADGELDLANADNQTLTRVWDAEGDEQLRGYSQVMSGFSTFFYIITPRDSGIETLADLEGRTLNGHTPGAILNIFTDIFTQALYDEGIVAEGSITLQQNAMTETMDSMLSGTTDAQVGYSFAGDIPGWMAQAEARDLQFHSIPIDPVLHDAMEAEGFAVVDDPAVDEFRRLDPDIPQGEPFYTSGIVTIMVANDSVPEDSIYILMNEWQRHAEENAEAHPANAVYLEPGYMSEYLLANLPVHPGAERFYSEN